MRCFHCILWKPKIHYRPDKSLELVHILGHINVDRSFGLDPSGFSTITQCIIVFSRSSINKF